MAALFTKEYALVWVVLLALALFLPVRKLVFVLYVRRAERIAGERADEAEQARLFKRASFTAALLCLVFSYLYVRNLFG